MCKLTSVLVGAANRTGAHPDSCHFHDLRHTGNTLAAATGARMAELIARMGHGSTPAATVYQHATNDRDEAIADALGSSGSRIR